MKEGGAPRILAGEWRGRALAVPRGRATRPLRALVRKSLFDVLENRSGGLDGARVLDLFAGAGTFAFEALSRGAASAVLVDQGRAAREAQAASARAFGAGARVELRGGDALAFPGPDHTGPGATAPFDLVFAGPPYRLWQEERAALDRLLDRMAPLVAPGGILVVEAPARAASPRPAGCTPLQARIYGDTRLSLFERDTAT